MSFIELIKNIILYKKKICAILSIAKYFIEQNNTRIDSCPNKLASYLVRGIRTLLHREISRPWLKQKRALRQRLHIKFWPRFISHHLLGVCSCLLAITGIIKFVHGVEHIRKLFSQVLLRRDEYYYTISTFFASLITAHISLEFVFNLKSNFDRVISRSANKLVVA